LYLEGLDRGLNVCMKSRRVLVACEILDSILLFHRAKIIANFTLVML